MRTGFLLHLTSSPPSASPSSVLVTWCVGSGRWACLIACGFIHNYSLYLKPKLKYADGAGCLWTAASHGLYSRAESTRRRDVGQPRSAGFRRREEDAADADADAEAAAAERRRLQRVAVVSQLAQSGGKLLQHRPYRPVHSR